MITSGKAFMLGFVAVLMFILYFALAAMWFAACQLIWKDELMGGIAAYVFVVIPLCFTGARAAYKTVWKQAEKEAEEES